jgi:hypothetical protein
LLIFIILVMILENKEVSILFEWEFFRLSWANLFKISDTIRFIHYMIYFLIEVIGILSLILVQLIPNV